MKKYELAYDNYKGAIVRAENLHTGDNEIVQNERYVEAEYAEKLEQLNKEMLEVLKKCLLPIEISYNSEIAQRTPSNCHWMLSRKELIEKIQSIIAKAEEE